MRCENVYNLLPLCHCGSAGDALKEDYHSRQEKKSSTCGPTQCGQRLSILIRDAQNNYDWYDGTIRHQDGQFVIIEWDQGRSLEKLDLDEEHLHSAEQHPMRGAY